MIEAFTKAWFAHMHEVRAKFEQKAPEDYAAIVRAVVEILNDKDEYDAPDPNRIHVINDGDYQGTLVFVISGNGYQPDRYWYCRISYGSCSGCDTLEGLRNYRYDEPPEKEEVDGYMTLALHIVQQLREMGGETV